MDSEHVDLDDAPPLGRVDVPGCAVLVADARVGDEELDRAKVALGLGDHPFDSLAVRDVDLEREAADLVRYLVDLPARSRRDGNARPCRRKLAGDVRADPAAAAGDERDLLLKVVGHRRRIVGGSRSRASPRRTWRARPGRGSGARIRSRS